MAKTIEQAIEDVINREGEYSDHPNDRGGPTRWGITEQVARANGYPGRMQDLPKDFARAVYRDQYYVSPGFEKVAKVSQKVSEELVDTGVNCGPQTAARFLQQALNALNRQAKDYPDMAVDGWIGNTTIACLNAYLKFRGVEGEKVLLTTLNGLQLAYYVGLGEKRPTQEDFMFGWIKERVVIL